MHKILVVDDDKLIRWSLKEIFTQEGYNVDTVQTANDALHLATHNPYHLIFADVDLKEKSGIDMLRKICRAQPLTKIVILSTYARDQIEPLLNNLNTFSIVEKPFRPEQIKAIAKEALNLQDVREGGEN